MSDRSSLTVCWVLCSVLALLGGSLVVGGCGGSPGSASEPAATSAAAEPTRVDAVPVARADLAVYAEATGYLQPWRKVDVAAEAGGKVLARRVENGQRVAAGSLLLQLDPRDREIELEEARAEWLKIRAAYAVSYELDDQRDGSLPVAPSRPAAAAPDLRKAEELYAGGLIAKRELDAARRQAEGQGVLSGSQRGEVRAATTGLTQAEQRIARATLALERTRILAPFSGRVADVAFEYGQQVSPGERLLTLLEDDRIKVEVDVLEADMVHLRPGAPARVRIPSLGGRTLAGTVYAINPQVDSKTGTGRVTVAIANPQQLLLSGLFANVELEVRQLPGRLVVPAAALLERQGRSLVFRVDGGRALWTYVQTGERSGDRVEIVDGLNEGDVVAVQGHFALAHEAPVEARIVDLPAADPPPPAPGSPRDGPRP